MDRFGRKFASVPAFVMLSAGMLFVAFSFDGLTLFLAATLMSVGNGFGSGSMMTLGADLSPGRRAASSWVSGGWSATPAAREVLYSWAAWPICGG